MKSKFSKIMGIGFALVLVASMMLFAIPTAAGPYDDLAPAIPNAWVEFPPTPGIAGGYFMDSQIERIGPIAEAINGDLFVYVEDATAPAAYWDIFKSTDGGRTWFPSTVPGKYAGGRVVDMVCSSLSEDVLYVTDGNYVYKSVNGGATFMLVAQSDLEYELMGKCGLTIVNEPITSIDLAYDGASEPIVFIGTRNAGNTYDVSYPDFAGFPVVGSVYWISDESFPAEWADLQLRCYGCCNTAWQPSGTPTGCWDVYAVGIAPDFTLTNKVYALISTLDDDCTGGAGIPRTRVVSSVGTTCAWTFVGELFFDCDYVTPNNFAIMHASRFAFPDDFADTRAMFMGVTAWNGTTTHVDGGDVYRVDDTIPPSLTLDLNVQGFITGCFGLANANICSLDIMGSTDNASLIAGAYNDWELQSGTEVYYSTDGGWTWDNSDKDPTGYNRTYTIWYGDSALATTKWCDCAVSMSCGDEVGKYWNQIALVNTVIDEVLDMSHAPGYVNDSSIMYVLTYDDDACESRADDTSTSLWRWDGTYWERVFSSWSWEFETYGLMDWVEVSPDFNDTDCLYITSTGFRMLRSTDQGCSWRILAYPCAPFPIISAWIVVDEETVLVAGADSTDAGGDYVAAPGTILRTTRHGTRPWSVFPVLDDTGTQTNDSGVDFDLSLPRNAESDVLFSDDDGQVFISFDLGATWNEITDAVGSASFAGATDQTYCVFDPGYGIADDPGENMIYAAGGTLVGRCNLNSAMLWSDQDWLYLSANTTGVCDPFAINRASGIDASGDTALYVADAGGATQSSAATADGTIGVRYACVVGPPETLCTCDLIIPVSTIEVLDGTFLVGEPLTIIENNLHCSTGDSIVGEIIVRGLLSNAMGRILIDEDEETGCSICVVNNGAVEVLYSSLAVVSASAAGTVNPTGVWRTLNPMDLISEASGLNFVEWELLALGPPHVLLHPIAGLTWDTLVYPDDLWLTAGSNMLWVLDNTQDASWEDIYMWHDVLAVQVIAVAPADGALLASTSTVTLEWAALDGATSYEVYVYSYCAACPTHMNLFYNDTTTETCIVIPGLSAGVQYYWKVRVACDSPQVSKWSDLRDFSTALGGVPYLCSPYCGQDNVILPTNFAWDAVAGATSYEVQVATDEAFTNIVASGTPGVNAWTPSAALDYSTVYFWRVRAVNNGVTSAWTVCIFTTMDEAAEPVEPPPTVVVEQNEVTPVWIWVIIAIGGALTIAVIVLIVSTRRVP